MKNKLIYVSGQGKGNEHQIHTVDERLLGVDCIAVASNKACADEIVRACNSHYELVEALLELVVLIKTEYPAQEETWLHSARAALKRAKGEV